MTNESLYDKPSYNTDSGVRTGLMYLLIGGGIGAALALLFAPKSGTELRSDIADMSKRGYDEAVERAQQLRDQTADIYRSVKDKADEIFNRASTEMAETGDINSAAQSVVDNVSKTAQAAVDEANRDFQSGQQHRRPTDIM